MQELTMLQQVVLIVGLIVSSASLASIIAGVIWIGKQARKQKKDVDEAEKKRTEEEAIHKTNLTRDLKDLKDRVAKIDDTLNDGLKANIQEIKNSCITCSGKFDREIEKVNGRINLVESEIHSHVESTRRE